MCLMIFFYPFLGYGLPKSSLWSTTNSDMDRSDPVPTHRFAYTATEQGLGIFLISKDLWIVGPITPKDPSVRSL